MFAKNTPFQNQPNFHTFSQNKHFKFQNSEKGKFDVFVTHFTCLSRLCHASRLPHGSTNTCKWGNTCPRTPFRSARRCIEQDRRNIKSLVLQVICLVCSSLLVKRLILDSYSLKMSAKAIYETDGKSILAKCFQTSCYVKNKFAVVVQDTNWDELAQENPWIASEVSCCKIQLVSTLQAKI